MTGYSRLQLMGGRVKKMRNLVLTGMYWMGKTECFVFEWFWFIHSSGEMRLECGFTHIYSGENWHTLVNNEKLLLYDSHLENRVEERSRLFYLASQLLLCVGFWHVEDVHGSFRLGCQCDPSCHGWLRRIKANLHIHFVRFPGLFPALLWSEHLMHLIMLSHWVWLCLDKREGLAGLDVVIVHAGQAGGWAG